MTEPSSWTIPTIEQRLCSEVALALRLNESDVSPDTSLQSLGMDSLRFVSLLITIEKTFGISLIKSGLSRDALRSVGTLAVAIHAGLQKT